LLNQSTRNAVRTKNCTFTFKAKDMTLANRTFKAEVKDLAQRPSANVSAGLREKYNNASVSRYCTT